MFDQISSVTTTCVLGSWSRQCLSLMILIETRHVYSTSNIISLQDTSSVIKYAKNHEKPTASIKFQQNFRNKFYQVKTCLWKHIFEVGLIILAIIQWNWKLSFFFCFLFLKYLFIISHIAVDLSHMNNHYVAAQVQAIWVKKEDWHLCLVNFLVYVLLDIGVFTIFIVQCTKIKELNALVA